MQRRHIEYGEPEGLFARFRQILIDCTEFFLFIIPAHIGFDRTDGGKVFFNHMVELIHYLLQHTVHWRDLVYDRKQDKGEQRRAHKEHKCEPRVHIERKPKSHNEHDRAARERAKPAVDGVLQNGHIRRHACDERGGVKAVQIREGELLHLFIFRLTDTRAPAVSGTGGKARIQ